ncbi:DUF3854 domain-containing protein, partial [Acidithiobacillus ferrooxidans]|uniref:DUF3854 domain-containing protein n=1 Tax=Acidithiobacillus ferrooxidans TaxID=920 RepID=UPI001C07BE18
CHNEDTPRYLSRGATTSHLYIPPQLQAALFKSKTLIITEGEKKAARACKAGFPTVALAGIRMYRDSRDKTQLLPEITALLKTLYEDGTIDMVAVIYDSDGHPLAKTQLPSDEAVAATYTAFKNNTFVQNKDVFKSALDLVGLIRLAVPGLLVGHGWCKPLLETVTGAKGGKARFVRHRGIDDVLQIGNGGVADLRTWVEAAAEKAQPGDGEGGYLPLGSSSDGKGVWLWSKHQDSLIDATSAHLSNPATLAGLVGVSWLSQRYMKIDKQGNTDIDTKRASMEIAAACCGRGKFNVEGRVFGTGTWLTEEGDMVVNTAREVFTSDGESLPRIDETLRRREIYTNSGSYPPPAYQAVSDAEYKAVIQKIGSALDQWQYASEVGGELVLGWMVMTVFLGAMTSRPTLWLVAPRGSGKSHMARFIKSCLGGYAWHTDQGKESTSAGIRQMLQMSSSPCILDEMEKDNTDMSISGEKAVAAILSLIRSAYTAGSDIKKGTADQSGKSFRIMTSFCCVSIADPGLDPADLTRIAKIYLKPIQHNGKIGKPPALLSKDDAAAFFWGTIQRWTLYQALFAEVRDNWLAVAGNGESREVDTFGVLLAAALAARDCQVGRVRGLLDAAVPRLMDQIQEAREASQEADLILETLLSLHVEIQRHEIDDRGNERIQREKMSIGRALLVAQGRPASDEALALADVGMAVKEKDGQEYLVIALRHASLTKLFQGTRWKRDGAWSGGLREVEGVIWNRPARMSGTLIKCTWVPWDRLGLADAAPLGSGTGHRFPAPQQIF